MKKVSKKISLLWISILFCLQNVAAQTVPFSSDQWVFRAQDKKLEDFQGKPSLYLQGGIAYLKDVAFQNGIIEFDVFMQEQRSFFGPIFRIEDENNYEEFYLRSHLSGKPDAMQYTPVYNGVSAWQLYHDQGAPGSFDLNNWKMTALGGYNTPYVFTFGQWMHVKLLIADTSAEIYFNNEKEPTLQIRELKRGLKTGTIGVQAGAAPAHFANFSYTKMDKVNLAKAPLNAAPEEPNRIAKWLISETFGEKELENQTQLPDAFLKTRQWGALEAERTGLVNISKLRERTPEKNTVLAKFELNATKDQLKKLELGFSDRARVYCNGILLYSGNNTYQSQDYRHLGTIGFYDAVYLPLKKGKNEIMIAVSETFGGWGIQGKLENQDAINP